MHTYAAYACQVYTFKTFQNKDRTKINKANHCRDKHSHTVAIRQIFQLQNALHWLFNDFVKTEFQLLLLSIVFRVLLCPFLLSHLLLQTCYFRLAPSSWEPFSIGSIEGDTAFLEKPWWRPVETFVPLRGVKGFFLPRSIPLQFIKQINHILVDTEQHVILKLWVPKTNEDILRSASTVKWINHVDVLWALSRGIDYIIKISLQKGVNKGDSH